MFLRETRDVLTTGYVLFSFYENPARVYFHVAYFPRVGSYGRYV